MLIFGIQATAFLVLPSSYTEVRDDMGNVSSVMLDASYANTNSIIDIPLIGYVMRLIYAILSPFPWINFTQLSIYGGNPLFLIVHIFSSFFAAWIIISTIFRFDLILKSSDTNKTIIIFGLSIAISLMFAAVAFNVYLAPALPFLAIVLLKKSYRVSIMYPIGFILFMEIIAHIARFIRL